MGTAVAEQSALGAHVAQSHRALRASRRSKMRSNTVTSPRAITAPAGPRSRQADSRIALNRLATERAPGSNAAGACTAVASLCLTETRTLRVVRDYAERIVHVHAKDMEIDREGPLPGTARATRAGLADPRLPGLGEVGWGLFIGRLYRVGYDYLVSTEHEHRAFEHTPELVERGFLIARDALAPYIH